MKPDALGVFFWRLLLVYFFRSTKNSDCAFKNTSRQGKALFFGILKSSFFVLFGSELINLKNVSCNKKFSLWFSNCFQLSTKAVYVLRIFEYARIRQTKLTKLTTELNEPGWFFIHISLFFAYFKSDGFILILRNFFWDIWQNLISLIICFLCIKAPFESLQLLA